MVKHDVIYSLENIDIAQLCMKYNPFRFESVQDGILMLWPHLYRHEKAHKIAIYAMVTHSYKWWTYIYCA